MNDPHNVENARQRSQQAQQAAAQQCQALAQLYRACFMSEAGQKVLDDLRRCYGGSTTGHSPRQTELHSAQRDVLMRIEDLMTLATEEPGAAITALAQADQHLANLMNPWSRYERR